MQLFLIRHAIAAPAADGQPDAERPLTDEGHERFARAARGLDRLGIRLDRVLHSPWTRAVQTAELLHRILDGESEVEPALARDPDAELAARLARGERVAAVGHEPWMSELLALLVTGNKTHAARFRFKKGQVAWLEGEPKARGMELVAFLPPRVLRRI
ncbi:MAG TPA: phosphohistidine phosphatase SixA [Kofleriaceae bacterium]|nr:phosphohistidine phosphatase SixA [Kofleriaceae bacterium]